MLSKPNIIVIVLIHSFLCQELILLDIKLPLALSEFSYGVYNGTLTIINGIYFNHPQTAAQFKCITASYSILLSDWRNDSHFMQYNSTNVPFGATTILYAAQTAIQKENILYGLPNTNPNT
eukprot:359935_1